MHDYFSYLLDLMKIITHARVIIDTSHWNKETYNTDSALSFITLYYTSKHFPNTKRMKRCMIFLIYKEIQTKEDDDDVINQVIYN